MLVIPRSRPVLWLLAAVMVCLLVAPGVAQKSDSTAVAVQAGGADQASVKSAVPMWLRNLLPEHVRGRELVGLRLWQWVALLVLIILGVAVDTAIRTISRPAIAALTRRFSGSLDKGMRDRTVRALGLLAGAIVWVVMVRLLALSGNTRDLARSATGFYMVLVGTLAGMRVIDLVAAVLAEAARKTEAKFDDVLVPLVRRAAKVFMFAVGVIYGAQNLNINIVPLITGLGIGGLAFAFAAKDTIENFFGSIAVILDRPFEVGDWVVVGDVEGTIEELGFRSTRIRTFYNSQVTVPNATLVRATVDNLGRRTYRRWKTTLGVQYDTTPEQLLAFTEGIRELIRQHPFTRKDFYQVWCYDFGDFSLNVLVYMFFVVPDWATELRERERLFVDIVRLADQLGVQFAFPTQTVHLYKEAHSEYEQAHTVPSGDHDEQSRVRGIAAAQRITTEQPWQKEKPDGVKFTVGEEKVSSRLGGGSDAGS